MRIRGRKAMEGLMLKEGEARFEGSKDEKISGVMARLEEGVIGSVEGF